MAHGVRSLAKFLLQVAKWCALFAVADALAEFGHWAPLGPALLGAVALLLAFEAWLSARSHFRTRLLHTLSFAIPGVMWRLFGWFLRNVGGYYESPAAKGFAVLEAVAEYFYYTVAALLPSLLLLVLAFRSTAPRRERTAYLVTSTSAVLATLNIALLCSFIMGSVWLQLRF